MSWWPSSWGTRRDPRTIFSEWRDTLDAIEWPILALDAEGRIDRLNRAAQRLSGLQFEELLGRPVGAIGSWQPWPEIARLVQAVVATGASQSRNVTGDRTKVWQISARRAEHAAPAGGRIIVVARDVTAVAHLEAQLRRSETMAFLGALVSGVAHEVRNPLFSISATIDALGVRGGDREDLAPFLATLRGEVDRLGRLMHDLLDYGRPPALDLCDVDVGEVVTGAVRGCASHAQRGQVSLRNGVEIGRFRLRVDPVRLGQALQNLIENAVHYSPVGSTVEIRAAIFAEQARDWIELSVADQGPGITPDDLPRIFDPFYTRRRGGTGLGLSIVKRIVEAHGGTVEAGNAGEGGAVVTVSLPMSDAGGR